MMSKMVIDRREDNVSTIQRTKAKVKENGFLEQLFENLGWQLELYNEKLQMIIG